MATMKNIWIDKELAFQAINIYYFVFSLYALITTLFMIYGLFIALVKINIVIYSLQVSDIVTVHKQK